jgi:hypothetical protein
MRTRVAILTLAALLPLAGRAYPQQAQPRELIVYDGDLAASPAQITLSSWGSGEAQEVYERYYLGPRVIKLKSQGFYQGGVLEFGKPLPLGEWLAEPNAYLELMIFPAQAARPKVTPAQLGALAGGAAALPPGLNLPGLAGMNLGALGGLLGGIELPSLEAAGAPSGPAVFTLKHLRLLAFSDSGPLEARPWPLHPGTGSKGWRRVAIPLSVFQGKEKGRELRGLAIFADASDSFYIGQIKLTVDETPIALDIKADKSAPRVGEVVTFNAKVEAGDTLTEVRWRFGPGAEVTGEKVSYIYQAPGDYQVTCLAEAVAGAKKPAEKSLEMRVLP